ncbi:PASTA domain-containing protein [Patulibacter sp. SYSU D01012]|uniref:PASTA domain-containing protein n=1 Tax=Patulibacter sp. SYSU D01012 TaxID=2817381 RepID=UPI001B306874|nr:PASTA domain-containing protein [Patulibacter sp. SYSU D01012]
MSSRVLPRSAALATVSLVLLLLLAAAAHAQATRTWVSGVGDDVNPCSRTAPCKTFAGAISKTASGGEINAIDAGGYGTLTVAKPITVDGTGVLASVLNSGGVSGVVVNAPGADVVLRGLDVYGATSVPLTCGVSSGVRILAARSVRIENTRIGAQVGGAGVNVVPTAGDVDVILDHVSIHDACGAGVAVEPVAGATADVTVRDSSITSTASGVRVGDGGRLWLSGTTVFGNDVGLEPVGGGQLLSYFGTNQVHGNGTDGAPTTVLGGPATGPVGAAGPAGPPGPVGPVGPAATVTTTAKSGGADADDGCLVPKLVGLSRKKAAARLEAAGCALGKVKQRRGPKKAVGRVVAQARKAGTALPAGTEVGVTVGRKR